MATVHTHSPRKGNTRKFRNSLRFRRQHCDLRHLVPGGFRVLTQNWTSKKLAAELQQNETMPEAAGVEILENLQPVVRLYISSVARRAS
eukprot:3397050-Rhodomonas_salina.4